MPCKFHPHRDHREGSDPRPRSVVRDPREPEDHQPVPPVDRSGRWSRRHRQRLLVGCGAGPGRDVGQLRRAAVFRPCAGSLWQEHVIDALDGYTDLRPGKVIFPPITLWHTGGVTGAGRGEPPTGLTGWSIFIETEDGAASHIALTAEDAGKIACASAESIWHRLHRGEPMPEDWREALNRMQDQGCIDSVTVSEHVL